MTDNDEVLSTEQETPPLPPAAPEPNEPSGVAGMVPVTSVGAGGELALRRGAAGVELPRTRCRRR